MTQITVTAKPKWTNTGLAVPADTVIRIKYISGTWTQQDPGLPYVDADGYPPPTMQDMTKTPIPSAPESCLIGWIGTGTPAPYSGGPVPGAFDVLKSALIKSTGGTLWLGINDADEANNAGSMIVEIQTGWLLDTNGIDFYPGDTVRIDFCAAESDGIAKVFDPAGSIKTSKSTQLYNCTYFSYQVSAQDPIGTYHVKLYDSDGGVRFEVTYTVHTKAETPPPITTVLPVPPVLDTCDFPALSWNFIDVMIGLARWIMCTLRNILAQVAWIVSALAALIPQLLAGIAYFLTLKWITDWIQAFFDRLDIWISNKFGIDPNLPFFEELIKKALTWIGGFLDAAAEERMRIRGWK